MSWFGIEITTTLVVQVSLYLVLIFLFLGFLHPQGLLKRLDTLLKRYRGFDTYFKIGIWGSVVFLSIVFLISGFDYCDEQGACQNKFTGLLKSSPNEFGDALAGIAGTLAFLWIIVTVLLQSRELSSQRKELELARRESKRMATALEAQAAVFRDEMRERQWMRAEKNLDQLANSITRKVQYIARFEKPFVATSSKDSDFYKIGQKVTHNVFEKDYVSLDQDAIIEGLSRRLIVLKFVRMICGDDCEIESRLKMKEQFLELQNLFEQVFELESTLSSAQRIRLQRLNIFEAAKHLSSLLEKDVWEPADDDTM